MLALFLLRKNISFFGKAFFLKERFVCNEYFIFLLIMASSLVLTKIVRFILVRYLEVFVAQTKSDIDDAILKIITKPLCIFVVFTGFYFALKSLSVLAPYSTEINNVFFVGVVLLLSQIISRIFGVVISRWLKVQSTIVSHFCSKCTSNCGYGISIPSSLLNVSRIPFVRSNLTVQ